MHSDNPVPEIVSFLTVEEEDDLILAFAIDAGDAGEIVSLILMRTPKYEGFLDPAERGVKVSHEEYPEHEDELLVKIRFTSPVTEIASTRRHYVLDLSRVEEAELSAGREILVRMNFDDSFELELPTPQGM